MNQHKYLIEQIKTIVSQAQSLTIRSVNALQIASNYLIGQRIINFEQGGTERAEYGEAILKELAAALTNEFGRGYSLTNLKLMRKFYLTYQAKIGQTASDISLVHQKSQTVSDQLQKSGTLFAQFPLSWSHYVFLMTVNDLDERSFYEIETINGNWSLRELKRQFNSSLYERLALSRDKDEVKKLGNKGSFLQHLKML
jgi:hypothetical protein